MNTDLNPSNLSDKQATDLYAQKYIKKIAELYTGSIRYAATSRIAGLTAIIQKIYQDGYEDGANSIEK
jgi:hypothetical protein